MNAASLLLCPEYFDGRLNGIGRVSEILYSALPHSVHPNEVWSANEVAGSAPKPHRAFARNYPRMLSCGLARGVIRPPSLVACSHTGLAPVARCLAARAPHGYFVFLHGVEVWRRLKFRSAWGLRGARVLLANSRFTMEQFGRHNPQLKDLPIIVTPLGIRASEPLSVPAKPKRRSQVLCVTRLTRADRYKNVRLLVRALASVVRVQPGARLLVVGDGDDRADLERFARETLPPESYKFFGRLPDEQLLELWRQSAVFALPSDGEGFGLVFAEAMAHGLPCLCGNRDAAREVVQHGVTGLAIDSADEPAWINAITELLTRPEYARALGEAGRKRYAEHFTISAFETRLRTALQEVQILTPIR
jgi:phosphatidylinositol alpha-1,6-mannosyltransferase